MNYRRSKLSKARVGKLFGSSTPNEFSKPSIDPHDNNFFKRIQIRAAERRAMPRGEAEGHTALGAKILDKWRQTYIV